jgi:hypothetical protein
MVATGAGRGPGTLRTGADPRTDGRGDARGIQGDIEEALVACERAAESSRASRDGAGLAHALQYLGFIAVCAGELDEARPLLPPVLINAARLVAPGVVHRSSDIRAVHFGHRHPRWSSPLGRGEPDGSLDW